MSASDAVSTEQFEFVTLDGLLAYGELLAQRTSSDRAVLPPSPPPITDRRRRAEQGTTELRTFIQGLPAGLPSAEAYRAARHRLMADACGGDPLVFYAAWNLLLARGDLAPLYRAPIGATQKTRASPPGGHRAASQSDPAAGRGPHRLGSGRRPVLAASSGLGRPHVVFYDAPRPVGSRK